MQARGGNILTHADFRQQRDAHTLHGEALQQADAVGAIAPADGDFRRRFARKQPPRIHPLKTQTAVRSQLCGRLRRTLRLHIIRRGVELARRVHQQMRDKPGIGQFPRAHHQVKRLGDEIDPARRHIQFQFNIRKLRGELRQERREERISEIHRQRQAQHPARQRVLPVQFRMNEARLLDQRQGALQIVAAGFGQLDFARGAVKKRHAQRATAGLILSEAINISADALGSPLTPGIFTEAQIAAWQKVTAAVHEKGGLIYAQLWHTGRVAHSIDRNGILPGAPSAIAINIEGVKHFTAQGPKDYETPRELTRAEIRQIIADYAQAAKNAITAGFDGVEFHAANGYLPQQFLADSSNQRNDEYGGSIENKARFTLEAMQAIIAAIGGDKVGIKISPLHPYAGIAFNDPVATYHYLIGALNKLDFSFVEIMKRSPAFPLLPHYPQDDEIERFGKMVEKTLIAGTGYNAESGEKELEKGIADLIAFGAPFLANPDLPRRFALGAELNTPDRATMFGGGAQGYIDYPFLP